MPYVPPPRIPPALLPDGRQVRGKTPFAGGIRKRWRDDAGHIYEWDYLHGTLEKYNARGQHLGELDPITGETLAPPDSSRRIDP